MRELPHDIDDLRLAPLLIQLDDRLAELGALDVSDLPLRLALDSDVPHWDEVRRQDAVLQTIARDIDLGGWVLSWDPRGLRVAHDAHAVVLGVPRSVTDYLAPL